MTFLEMFLEMPNVYKISRWGGVENRTGYISETKYVKEILKKLGISYREISYKSGVVKSKKNLITSIDRGFVLLARTKNVKGERVGYMIDFTWQKNMKDIIPTFIDEMLRKEKNIDPSQLSVLLIARQGCGEHTAKRYLEEKGITNIKEFFLSNERNDNQKPKLLSFIPFGAASYCPVSIIFMPTTGEVFISRIKSMYKKTSTKLGHKITKYESEMLEEYPEKIPSFLSIPEDFKIHNIRLPFFYTILE
ncbi:hypothetical protein HOC80_03410 [archaeon]|nr:hypothetical protein [archaeon]